jgi:hypothetical protein
MLFTWSGRAGGVGGGWVGQPTVCERLFLMCNIVFCEVGFNKFLHTTYLREPSSSYYDILTGKKFISLGLVSIREKAWVY